MIHEIEEIDDTPRLYPIPRTANRKRLSSYGSYGTSQPKVGVAAALTYFEGKSSKEKSNMIIELLQTLSMEDQDSQTPECLRTVLFSFLHARDKVSEIMTSFSDDIVCSNPLDNMITALTQHPARITDKWRRCVRCLLITESPKTPGHFRYLIWVLCYIPYTGLAVFSYAITRVPVYTAVSVSCEFVFSTL